MSGSSPVDLKEAEGVANPVVTARDVTDRKARFVADPFVIRKGGLWYLFFEVMSCGTEQGDIGYATSTDGVRWRYERIVLDEPFHLSYPQVFEHDGHFYMIPESRQAGGIRLYEAESFPSGWKLKQVLVEGSYADSSIAFYDDRWWMFTVGESYSLEIFYADSLFGPWKRHAGSPFYENDKSRTRGAGRIVLYQGKLIRFAQDNRLHYGGAVRGFVIDTLTPTEFEEHSVEKDPVLGAEGSGWREVGMHQLDPVEVSPGHWTAVADGTGYVPFD
jgi:hypothetical protein